MRESYTHIVDLAEEVEPPPDDGILTAQLFNDDDVKAEPAGAVSKRWRDEKVLWTVWRLPEFAPDDNSLRIYRRFTEDAI